MDNITIMEGIELDAFLTGLGADVIARRDIHTIRFHQREDGIAIKINSGMWSPTIGRRADSGGY